MNVVLCCHGQSLWIDGEQVAFGAKRKNSRMGSVVFCCLVASAVKRSMPDDTDVAFVEERLPLAPSRPPSSSSESRRAEKALAGLGRTIGAVDSSLKSKITRIVRLTRGRVSIDWSKAKSVKVHCAECAWDGTSPVMEPEWLVSLRATGPRETTASAVESGESFLRVESSVSDGLGVTVRVGLSRWPWKEPTREMAASMKVEFDNGAKGVLDVVELGSDISAKYDSVSALSKESVLCVRFLSGDVPDDQTLVAELELLVRELVHHG